MNNYTKLLIFWYCQLSHGSEPLKCEGACSAEHTERALIRPARCLLAGVQANQTCYHPRTLIWFQYWVRVIVLVARRTWVG
jgi:hypothetical protein